MTTEQQIQEKLDTEEWMRMDVILIMISYGWEMVDNKVTNGDKIFDRWLDAIEYQIKRGT